MRADARRNVEQIVASAGVAFARDGADASLEEIVRAAGVGSATLHRHFRSRRALLEAVFLELVQELCAGAHAALTAAADTGTGAALSGWLREVGRHAASNRGMAAALAGGDPSFGAGCHSMIIAAGEALLSRAQEAGAVRRDVAISDLLRLTSAIALANEADANGAAETDRLVALALSGIAPT